MTKCLTVNLITYSTVLGLFTISLNESMRKCLSLFLAAKRTGLSYSTGSLCPNVFALFNVGFIVAKDTVDGITGSECEQKDH